MMSSLRMRPFSPVPCIWLRSIWCSCAMRRASGETRSSVAVVLDALGAADDAVLVPLLALAPGPLADGAPPFPGALGALLEAAVLVEEALVVAPASSISAISAPTLTV